MAPLTLARNGQLPANKLQTAPPARRAGAHRRATAPLHRPLHAIHLLREEGKSVGLLDGRYAQDELDDAGEYPDGDAFNAKTGPIYISLFQTYLRSELGVDLDKRYLPGNNEANGKWKRPANRRGAFAGFVDVTGNLAQGTKDNEALRVFAAAGYDDLTTSYFATRYMLEHSGIDAARLTIKDYPGGHMMYLYRPSADAVSDDIVAFIKAGKPR